MSKSTATNARSPDRAISDSLSDTLGRETFVSRLRGALINSETGRSTGIIIGLTGEWGSGKSSILNLLAKDIRKHHDYALIVRFDPWLISGRNDLITTFIGQVTGTINANPTAQEDLKAWGRTLEKYGSHLASLADFAKPGASVVLKAFFGFLKSLVGTKKNATLEGLRTELIEQLNELRLPIVVLIDEVDRVEDDEIRAIAQLVRSVVDFPGISYVLAYDAKRVIEALGHGAERDQKTARGRRYLEKIVQLQVPIPITFESEITELLSAEFDAMRSEFRSIPKNFIDMERYENLIGTLAPETIKTLRDVKRLTGTYHALAGMVGEEVDWIDLIAYATLLINSPQTVENIKRHPDDFAEDSFTKRSVNRRFIWNKKTPEERLNELVHPQENDAGTRELLRFLFPSLSNNQIPDDRPDALCFNRPLLTVLRLGLITGSYSKSAISAFLKRPAGEITEQLRQAYANDTLSDLLDRFTDLYPTLDDLNHLEIWLGIADFLKKPDCEWMSSYDPRSDIIRNWSRVLLISVRKNRSLAPKAKEVFNSLLASGEVQLTSDWLRQHVFTYGLFRREKRGGEAYFFNAVETQFAIDSAIESWRKLHLEGRLLPCNWDLQPAFLLLDSGSWDSQCRELLDMALNDHRATTGFALLLFGGKNTVDQKTIDGLCTYEHFIERVKTLLELQTQIHETATAALLKALGKDDWGERSNESE